MMSQNSSISSSKTFRGYVRALLTFTVLLSGGFSLLVAYGYQHGWMDFAFIKLYQYQLSKIESDARPDIVFVGDSSLGNAIDADEFQRLSGKHVQNLALTGAYGYAGTFNMIRRVTQANNPELVIIMHTPDIFTRPIAYDGYLHTALSLKDWRDIPFSILVKTFTNFDAVMSMARTFVRKSGMPDNMVISNDYIRQGPALNLDDNSNHQLSEASINLEKKMFLKKISAFCGDNGLQCVYAFGPWLELFCQQSQSFIKKTKEIVISTGLRVATEQPKCLSPNELGDAWDHVAPHSKKEATSFYFKKLQPFL